MEILDWLMEGDSSIKKLVKTNLLNEVYDVDLISEGWGAEYLKYQNEDHSWGNSFYNPKWACTHYTLLELRNLLMPPLPEIKKSIQYIIDHHKISDGGVNPNVKAENGDICINGMFLNYSSYFKMDESDLKSIVDLILSLQISDGGYNCRVIRSGCRHSSLHSTICVLEGLQSYLMSDYQYRRTEVIKQQSEAEEFILKHKLYKSDHTGEVIHPNMTVFSYPSRYKYNVLRALYYFAMSKHQYDHRMGDAIELVLKKRTKSGTWKMPAKHAGKQFFIMEPGGNPSRIITYMASVVLKSYEVDYKAHNNS